MERVVNTYYMIHRDGLSRLSPVILREGNKVWHGAVKKKLNGVTMYYLFLDSIYVKLWKDRKGDLLYTIDNYQAELFFNEEPQVWGTEIALSNLGWDDNTLTYKDTKVKFTIPIFRVMSQIHMWLPTPVAYLLFNMFVDPTGQDSFPHLRIRDEEHAG